MRADTRQEGGLRPPSRDAGTIITAFVLLPGAFVLGIVATVLLFRPARPVERPVMGAIILDVQTRPTWVDPRTLVEFEDGTRTLLPGDLGEPGDAFYHPRSR